MNEIATIAETAITFAPEHPVTVLTDPKAYESLLATMKAEIEAFVPDVSTSKGRAAIKSLSYKIVRSKTLIDTAGKAFNEGARAQINKIDEQRRKIRAELDEIADSVRKPLTDWEAKEEERKTKVRDLQTQIANLSWVTPGDGSNLLGDRLGTLEAFDITDAVYGDESGPLKHLRDKSIEGLRTAIEHVKVREAEQAELARLREELAAKEKAEAEAKAEQERIAREKAAQERKARLAAERAAMEEEERKEREARLVEEARQAEARKAEEAIAAAQAEARRVQEAAQQAERARQAEVERVRREEEARAADAAHRASVVDAAVSALMTHCRLDQATAKTIVLAVINDEIPHMSVRF